MSSSIEIIISRFEKLTDKEKNQMTSALSRHLGKSIQISRSGLSNFSQNEIDIISHTLKGLIITKENVPDIAEAYERLKGTDLPNKISFGYLEDNGK